MQEWDPESDFIANRPVTDIASLNGETPEPSTWSRFSSWAGDGLSSLAGRARSAFSSAGSWLSGLFGREEAKPESGADSFMTGRDLSRDDSSGIELSSFSRPHAQDLDDDQSDSEVRPEVKSETPSSFEQGVGLSSDTSEAFEMKTPQRVGGRTIYANPKARSSGMPKEEFPVLPPLETSAAARKGAYTRQEEEDVFDYLHAAAKRRAAESNSWGKQLAAKASNAVGGVRELQEEAKARVTDKGTTGRTVADGALAAANLAVQVGTGFDASGAVNHTLNGVEAMSESEFRNDDMNLTGLDVAHRRLKRAQGWRQEAFGRLNSAVNPIQHAKARKDLEHIEKELGTRNSAFMAFARVTGKRDEHSLPALDEEQLEALSSGAAASPATMGETAAHYGSTALDGLSDVGSVLRSNANEGERELRSAVREGRPLTKAKAISGAGLIKTGLTTAAHFTTGGASTAALKGSSAISDALSATSAVGGGTDLVNAVAQGALSRWAKNFRTKKIHNEIQQGTYQQGKAVRDFHADTPDPDDPQAPQAGPTTKERAMNMAATGWAYAPAATKDSVVSWGKQQAMDGVHAAQGVSDRATHLFQRLMG